MTNQLNLSRPNERSMNNIELSWSPNFIPSRIHENWDDNSWNYSTEDERILRNFSEKKDSADIFSDKI